MTPSQWVASFGVMVFPNVSRVPGVPVVARICNGSTITSFIRIEPYTILNASGYLAEGRPGETPDKLSKNTRFETNLNCSRIQRSFSLEEERGKK